MMMMMSILMIMIKYIPAETAGGAILRVNVLDMDYDKSKYQ
jgi:hypothetical protein